MEEQLVQTAVRILPFATMEKITKFTENVTNDSKKLLKLMKILWANDLIGYYEVKEIFGKEKALAVRVNALRKSASVARGIYTAYPLITEQEYYQIVKDRDVLLKEPSHSKQMVSLKKRIENFYFSVLKKDKTSDLEILLQRAKNLKQEISLIKEVSEKVKNSTQIVQNLKNTMTCTEEMLENFVQTLIYARTILEIKAQKETNIAKIIKNVEKNKTQIYKTFHLLLYYIRDTELLLIDLERIMSLLINNKETKLCDINLKIQELQKVSSTLASVIEKEIS